MRLSIIIVNWNVRELLDRCLNSLFSNLTGGEFEVIVVDNASQDGSIEMVRRKFPQVKLIVNHENCGFAKACNQGIKIAQGKYLFFLNPDSQVTYNTYEKITDFMESHPQVGAGGCYLYYPDRRIQASFYRFTSLITVLGRSLLLYSFLPKNSLTAPLFSTYLRPKEQAEWVCGGAMVVRRQALENVGYFDETFFLFSEDEDLCYRMKQKGWKIALIPDTKVIHHHAQSAKKNTRNAIFYSYQSQFLLYKKYHPVYKAVIFRLIQFIGVSIRILFWLFQTVAGVNRKVSKQKFFGYLSVLLSDFHYRKSLMS